MLFAFLALLGGYAWIRYQMTGMGAGPAFFVRYERPVPLKRVLADLGRRGLVKDPAVLGWAAWLRHEKRMVGAGTYRFRPGMSGEEVLRALRKPVRQMVCIPEGWWIARVAERLEANDVCKASEYVALARNGAAFQSAVDFVLPKGSLEGYLYPDTYDLPPLLGARATILRQLDAFGKRVAAKTPKGVDLRRALVIGSMIQLEAGVDSDRPLIAGVIENRLRKGMRLEIDATVNYAIQEWKPFKPGEIAGIESPYSTYKHAGLPPGPICSPSAENVAAALNPAKTNALFYVARPDRTHFFAATYAQHLANIRMARAEWRKLGGPER